MNIFFRRSRPLWANPQDSVGRECTVLKNGSKCYIAIGPVADVFIDILPAIQRLLNDHQEDIERGETRTRPVGLGMYMVGPEPIRTTPTLVVSSLSKRQRGMIDRKSVV